MSNSTGTTGGDDPVMAQAIDWLLELERRDVSVDRISAWQRWLAEDVQHRHAFDRLQSVQECIGGFAPLPWPTDIEVAADRYDGAVPVSAWDPRVYADGPASPQRRWWWMASAAALVIAIGCGLALQAFDLRWPAAIRDYRVETATGELRRVRLTDGSAVTIGGRSRVRVDMNALAREVSLERGEAFFEVAKDAQRPFVVRAGEASITALGTAFDVRRANDRVTVAVAEGAVEVRGVEAKGISDQHAAKTVARLNAGQQIRVGPRHQAVPASVAPDAVAAWRDGRRQYLAESLADVIADLERDSNRRIVLDPAVASLSITGAVFEQDIGRWLRSLPAALPVRVRAEADGTVRIEPRQ